MSEAELSHLLAVQSATGAFPSRVDGPGGPVEDETCFVTAQVGLILGELLVGDNLEDDVLRAAAQQAFDRALDFVELCAADAPAGAFVFYPPRAATLRLGIALAPDADDTALAWLALMAGKRRSRAEARGRLPDLFEELRVRAPRRGDPPFVRTPLLRTWFASPNTSNPVDLIVNVNVVTALAAAGCLADTYSDLVVRIAVALPKGRILTRSELRTLAPYYADGGELSLALARATAAGVAALSDCFVPGDEPPPLNRDLYCNAHGRPIWRAPALQLARRLAQRLRRTAEPSSVDSTKASGGFHDVYA